MKRQLCLGAAVALTLLLACCARMSNVDSGQTAENVSAGEQAAYVGGEGGECSADQRVCDCMRTSAIIGLSEEEAEAACRTQ